MVQFFLVNECKLLKKFPYNERNSNSSKVLVFNISKSFILLSSTIKNFNFGNFSFKNDKSFILLCDKFIFINLLSVIGDDRNKLLLSIFSEIKSNSSILSLNSFLNKTLKMVLISIFLKNVWL